MRIIIILFLITPCLLFGQKEAEKILSDTSAAVGLIAEDAYVGKGVGLYCSINYDKLLIKGSMVLIAGIENCYRSEKNDTIRYFEIIYNKETFFVKKEFVYTEKSFYSQIENMPYTKADSFRKHAAFLSEALDYSNKSKALDFLESCKPFGVAVLEWSIYDESEHTDGTGVRIKVYNPTKKTIKYAWFSFVGYNPVDDVVRDIRGTKITVKGVGPIKPGESASYEYSYVWFTDLVETAKIVTIKIQYTDGTFKTIAKPTNVTMPQSYYKILFEDE